LDAFKRIIVYSIVVSLISLGFIVYVMGDAIEGAKIPDAESGIIASKGLISDEHAANYTVTLESGKVLYIVNNSTLYDELTVGSNYVFTCHIDFLGSMRIIDSAQLKKVQL
jgi:hypothetical protein